jgi:hypothetical protein
MGFNSEFKGLKELMMRMNIKMCVFFWVIPRHLNYPEENIRHTEHGESLKSRI